MAEECEYYYWDGDYCCAWRKKKEGYSSIDDDTVHRYCWKYNYEKCPRYKEAQEAKDPGGCYLTSACVYARGLADDCYELETLRQYRDTWLQSTTEGKALIKQYYEIAPKIVSAINKTPNSRAIYDGIYEKMVLPCVQFIEEQKYQEALELYRAMTIQLAKEYGG